MSGLVSLLLILLYNFVVNKIDCHFIFVGVPFQLMLMVCFFPSPLEQVVNAMLIITVAARASTLATTLTKNLFLFS